MKTLLGQMRYFRRHLASDVETRPGASAELSVHCDIPTFEWLVDHVEGRDPRVTTRNCVALMISGDFLQMEALTETCADYVAARVHQVLQQTGADLANLGEGLLEKIAGRMSDDALESLLATTSEEDSASDSKNDSASSDSKNDSDSVSDSKRALAATLYRVKTEALIASRVEDAGVTIARCAACGLLFSEKHRHGLRCPRARRHVDYHGDVIARHAPMKDFDVHSHIARLIARGHAWRDVYWHVWGVTRVIDRCGRCGAVVPASELAQCEYHPKPPRFDDPSHADADPSVGTFACCGSRAPRFDPTGGISLGGCEGRDHVFPALEELDEPRFAEGRKALETARRRRGLACEPFSKRPAATAPPPPDDDSGYRDDDQSEMATWRATRPANDLADNGIHAFGDHHSPGGVDVTWEVADRSSHKNGKAAVESEAGETDSDREILPFDHDYDTEAEMEGRRERWGGAAYACPPRPGREKPGETGEIFPGGEDEGDDFDLFGEGVDANDANKVGIVGRRLGRLRFLPPRLGPLLLRRLRRGRIGTQT